MTPAQELKMWEAVQKTLTHIPNELRSANHHHYLTEINGRVDKGREEQKYIKTRNDEQ